MVEVPDEVALDAFLARERCYLKHRLSGFAARVLRHQPHANQGPDDLVQEVVLRLLEDPARRSGGVARGLAPFLAYLRTTTARVAITLDRRLSGRMRCGNCLHHASWLGRCAHTNSPWNSREVEASADPRRLEPPCAVYASRKESARVDPNILAQTVAAEDDHDAHEDAQAVHQALVDLAQADPRAALMVRARMIEGRSYDELVRPGASLRTLKRDHARGLAWLRERLEADV